MIFLAFLNKSPENHSVFFRIRHLINRISLTSNIEQPETPEREIESKLL